MNKKTNPASVLLANTDYLLARVDQFLQADNLELAGITMLTAWKLIDKLIKAC